MYSNIEDLNLVNKTYSLNGTWQLRRLSDNMQVDAKVPGTVYTTLLEQGKMDDPFYGENEDNIKALSEYDYEYSREFNITKDMLSMDRVILECKGIDTCSEIYINDILIAKTENMHRIYDIDLKGYITEGTNIIRIVLHSPLKKIAREYTKFPIWGVTSTVSGYQHIRKCHSSFGWDWGPQLPDLGIFRDVLIKTSNYVALKDVYVRQKHTSGKVNLDVDIRSDLYDEANTKNFVNYDAYLYNASRMNIIHRSIFDLYSEFEVICNIYSPNDDKIASAKQELRSNMCFNFEISNPELWWVRGYGEQPLYRVEVLVQRRGDIYDAKIQRVGLRTLTVNRKKDKWGESFNFNINGINIFAMGANYIPEDNLIGRTSYERTKLLLENCIKSNFNTIRVWGGGYYPEDYFYDLCDEYGLIVWQDFMFACAAYNLTGKFQKNIEAEIVDNIIRFRNHPSLALWCGNNEMESAWLYWGLPKNDKLLEDYTIMFERLIPELVDKYDPDRMYWPSSPSSGGGMFEPCSDTHGDAHYWDVWHGKKPFDDFKNYYFRFASEYGFQSFPSIKTISTFAEEKDYNIYSPVMERHQKCIDNGHGNATIMYYMSQYYLYPTKFENILYASQVLQGECLKIAIEHFRRNRGRCMGSTYWQLNDCWPAASWATIDYLGRWKASQYYVKRAYAPVLLSADVEDDGFKLYVTNDSLELFEGKILCEVVNQKTGKVKEEIIECRVNPLSVESTYKITYDEVAYTEQDKRNTYVTYRLIKNDICISYDSFLLVKSKYFNFRKPHIKVNVSETKDAFEIYLHSDVFARHVGIEFRELDAILEDNYFDLYPDAITKVVLLKQNIGKTINDIGKKKADITADVLMNEIMIISEYDISS